MKGVTFLSGSSKHMYVMEYLEGGSLHNYLIHHKQSGNVVDAKRKILFLIDIAKVLLYHYSFCDLCEAGKLITMNMVQVFFSAITFLVSQYFCEIKCKVYSFL
jgi:serine/threonine protein kinase